MENTILTFDIGGSKLMAGIVSESGEVLKKAKVALPTGIDSNYILDRIFELHAELGEFNPTACGVAIPGLADPLTGMWIYASFSGISDFPIGEILSERLKIPVFIDNDVNVCAIGEKVYGAAKDADNFLWITVSNGIGGGLVLNGEIYRGQSLGAGEIGHFIVEEDDEKAYLCGCGNYGCLESSASGTGIQNMYKSASGTFKSALEVAELAKAGDAVSTEVYKRAGHYIGKAIFTAANLLNLEKVILGGGVSNDFDLLYPSIMAAESKYLFKAANKNLKIEKTALGYDASLIGCAGIAINN